MRKGNITKRGGRSFRIKIELDRDPKTGQRQYHLETVRGEVGESVTQVKTRARARLVELLHRLNTGQHVIHSATTIQAYIETWLEAPFGLNPKTAEIRP